MPTISAIYTAAVKSLSLQPRPTVYAGPAGIADDRRFHLIDGGGRLLTQRQRPQLARVDSRYDADSDCLTLIFPGGDEIAAPVELADPVRTVIWGRPVAGNVVAGPWNEALSQLCGGPVRLVKTANAGQSYDEYPLSILSQASIDLLRQVADGVTGNAPRFDARRFRPNLLLAGCAPHDEDSWLGGVIAVGAKLRLRLTAPDPRCAVTAVDPAAGVRDFDTPRLLRAYRPSARAPYFGVYAAVETPGAVAVGDAVALSIPPPGR